MFDKNPSRPCETHFVPYCIIFFLKVHLLWWFSLIRFKMAKSDKQHWARRWKFWIQAIRRSFSSVLGTVQSRSRLNAKTIENATNFPTLSNTPTDGGKVRYESFLFHFRDDILRTYITVIFASNYTLQYLVLAKSRPDNFLDLIPTKRETNLAKSNYTIVRVMYVPLLLQ